MIPPESTTASLVEMLEHSKDPRLREEAAWRVGGKLAEPRSRDAAFRADPNGVPDALAALVRALGDEGSFDYDAGEGGPPFTYIVADKAKEALANLGKMAVPALLAAWEPAGPFARSRIAELLAAAGAPPPR